MAVFINNPRKKLQHSFLDRNRTLITKAVSLVQVSQHAHKDDARILNN
jgi:hypothetical protein